jgi:hypothetical protein
MEASQAQLLSCYDQSLLESCIPLLVELLAFVPFVLHMLASLLISYL